MTGPAPPAPGAPGPDPSRLARRLRTPDAVVLGLGSMVGAGIFAAVAPAAGAAGSGLLLGLVLAGGVAYANATSSAQLAAIHPVSGGAYVYGSRQLGPLWGQAAGWAFIVGKLASCAAIALTFGRYAWPGAEIVVALAAVAALTAVNYLGVQRTARLTWLVVAVVVGVLLLVVVAVLAAGRAEVGNLVPLWGDRGALGVLRAAGFLFFAFAGYARIATLGEEVVDPARTIPRAVSVSVVAALSLYAGVAATALLALGAPALAEARAPIEEAVSAAGLPSLVPAVGLAAALATLGVLVSLLAGLSRMVFAMAADGVIPLPLDAVHPAHRVPHRAVVTVGAVVVALAVAVPLERAIGLSAFAVLLYYAVTNAAALTLRPEQRRFPRWLAAVGLAGCLALAATLPLPTVLAGVLLLAAGGGTSALLGRRRGG